MSEAYAELRALARRDPNVVGLFLGGSRGKGMAKEDSDYDVYLIVARKVGEYRRKFPLRHGDDPEVIVLSLAEFKRHAAVGSELEWNRYNFAHVRAELDKTGEVQQLLDEKGSLPKAAARDMAAEALDGYMNQYYRSAKSFRDGDALAARFDAAESVPYLLVALFALHERVRPYNKYLRWELEQHPLPGDEWRAGRLLPLLEAVVGGDLSVQRTLFADIERLARERGHGDVVDAWGADLTPLRGVYDRGQTPPQE
jgi:predicted nucleotidyltransferase